MKKILSIGLILLLVLSLFALAACGSKNMEENMTSISDELSSDMSSVDDELTENGNVTDESTEDNLLTTGEGILDDMTDALTTDDNGTTTAVAE